jgi:hypothetical protein
MAVSLGPWLAREGAQIDETGGEDKAVAVDDARAFGRGGRSAPGDIGDEAVLEEHAAALFAARGRIDETSVGEEDRGRRVQEGSGHNIGSSARDLLEDGLPEERSPRHPSPFRRLVNRP